MMRTGAPPAGAIVIDSMSLRDSEDWQGIALQCGPTQPHCCCSLLGLRQEQNIKVQSGIRTHNLRMESWNSELRIAKDGGANLDTRTINLSQVTSL